MRKLKMQQDEINASYVKTVLTCRIARECDTLERSSASERASNFTLDGTDNSISLKKKKKIEKKA